MRRLLPLQSTKRKSKIWGKSEVNTKKEEDQVALLPGSQLWTGTLTQTRETQTHHFHFSLLLTSLMKIFILSLKCLRDMTGNLDTVTAGSRL